MARAMRDASFMRPASLHRRIAFVLASSTLAALSMACLATVEGDRAATGECPPGERCSERTPDGLHFVGRAFFDQPQLRLGPVLVGGTFELGIRAPDGEPLPAYLASSEGNVFAVDRGQGVFGPVSNGEPLYEVDSHLVLRALRPGTSYVRITEPLSGALLDRLELEAVALEDVDVVVAQDPQRAHLYAGCDEMVGVRLLADDGNARIRAFDQGMVVRANGTMLREEPLFWDCVVYDVPADAAEVRFDLGVAGQTFQRTMPVRSLADDGLTTCPEPRD